MLIAESIIWLCMPCFNFQEHHWFSFRAFPLSPRFTVIQSPHHEDDFNRESKCKNGLTQWHEQAAPGGRWQKKCRTPPSTCSEVRPRTRFYRARKRRQDAGTQSHRVHFTCGRSKWHSSIWPISEHLLKYTGCKRTDAISWHHIHYIITLPPCQ